MGKQALAGLKVVEFGNYITAPFCSRIMADLGAEVIKVEPPSGDIARGYGPFPGDKKGPDQSGLFLSLNSGKKGVSLDLEVKKGQEAVREILKDADIFVENSNPSSFMAERGLDYPSLAKANPGLVMVSISPYGRTGPYKDYMGYDINASALGGLSINLGNPDREPLVIPYSQCDYQAALHAAAAAITAVLARGKLGRGQYIDISVSDVVLYCVRGMFLVTRWGGWKRKGKRPLVSVYPTGYFDCKDGNVCIATQTSRQWRKFIELMGNPEWSNDPYMRDGLQLGVQNPDKGDEVFKPWLAQFTREEVDKMARDHGITMGIVKRINEMVEEEHLKVRGLWTEIDDPELGKIRIPGMAYQMSATPWQINKPAPRLGEHNSEYLSGKGKKKPKSAGAGTEGKKIAKPLEGYRILDFGWNWAGPMAAQIMGDMGAEVIKIESATRQDVTRFLEYVKDFFQHNNRSKLSVTIDIKKPKGVELVKRLAKMSDIVLDNFASGVMEKNGLGYGSLREANPQIIAVSMSMAGQKGPRNDMKGFASIASSFSGLEGLVGYEDLGSVGLMSFGLGDVDIAIQGLYGVLAAVYHRERTGEGQFVDVSQIETIVDLMGEPILDYFLNNRVAGPRGNFHSEMAPHGMYPAKGEDEWISIAVGSEEEWKNFCKAIGEPSWTKEDRFQTMKSRLEHHAELDKLVSDWTRQQDRYGAMEVLQKAGVAAAPVLGIEDGDADPHIQSRGFRTEWEEPDGKKTDMYETPWKFSETQGRIWRLIPGLGEHNDYVFKEVMGMSEEEYQQLIEEEVIK